MPGARTASGPVAEPIRSVEELYGVHHTLLHGGLLRDRRPGGRPSTALSCGRGGAAMGHPTRLR